MAIELTLAKIASQVQASAAAPKNLFLGKSFVHGGLDVRVPYMDLMDTLQSCIHKAQDNGDKNYKTVAETTIKQLEKVARIQKLGSAENIDIITRVALAALKPNEIFPAAGKPAGKRKNNPIMDKAILQKVLSAFIFANESLSLVAVKLNSQYEDGKAEEKLGEMGSLLERRSQKNYRTLNIDIPQEKISSTTLAFYFRWIRSYNEETSGYSAQFTVNDLEELRGYLNHEDPHVRSGAEQIITYIETANLVTQREAAIKIYHKNEKDLLSTSDFSSGEMTTFLKEIHPLFRDMKEMGRPGGPTTINITKGMREFEKTYRFIYRYFYQELSRFMKPGEQQISKYPSTILGECYPLPTPEELETFFLYKPKPQPPKKKEEEPAAQAAAPPAQAAPVKPKEEIPDILAKKVFPVKEIVYSDRVTSAFEALGKPSHDVDSVWRHTFPLEMDQFLGTAYSQKREWINQTTGHPDTLYVMPGEVEVSKDEWKRCQFEWCIGADGKCYHRFCSYKEKNILIESWMSGTALTDENFPSLQQSYLDATWKAKPKDNKGEKITIALDPLWNFITFTDQTTNISCRIFKVGK